MEAEVEVETRECSESGFGDTAPWGLRLPLLVLAKTEVEDIDRRCPRERTVGEVGEWEWDCDCDCDCDQPAKLMNLSHKSGMAH